MDGIKGVKSILQGFMGYSLPSAVKPYGNKGENGKSLSGNLHILPKYSYGKDLPLKENHMDRYHSQKLRQPSKGKITKEVKNYHCKKSPKAIVNKAYDRRKGDQDQPQRRKQNMLGCMIFLKPVDHAYGKQSQQQGKDSILMRFLQIDGGMPELAVN